MLPGRVVGIVGTVHAGGRAGALALRIAGTGGGEAVCPAETMRAAFGGDGS